MLLGRLFILLPFGDVAYRLNIMSAFFGALTVWMVYLVIHLLLQKRAIAWVSAFLLAISYYFWQMSILTEVYTLHTFFLAFLLFLLLSWRKTPKPGYLFAFSFFYGLSLCNHTSGILFAPGFTWVILSSEHWRWSKLKLAPVMFAFFLTGLLPYIYLPLRVDANPALSYVGTYYNVDLTSLSGIFWMVSAQAYRFFSFDYSLHEILIETNRFLGHLWRTYFGAGVLIGLVGTGFLFKKHRSVLIGLLLIFTANAIFYINYRVIDKDTMFLPAYLVWAVFIGAGVCVLEAALEKISLRSEVFHTTTPVILFFLFIPGLIFNWRFVDMSQVNEPGQFALDVLETVPANSLIVAPWSPAVVLEYYHVVENHRPDILILNRSRRDVARYYHYWKLGMQREQILEIIAQETADYLRIEMTQRPVYAVDYDRDLAHHLEYLPEGNYFRIVESP
jgi:hypothetical protein